MTCVAFNRTPVEYGPLVLGADSRLIEGAPNLRRASLESAALFGGPLVRQLLEKCPLIGDRQHVIVDTKVSMLMPGWWPAIPGWHTDGVPRGGNGDPAGTDSPSLLEQQRQDEDGYFPRFHTIHVGNDCRTRFISDELDLHLEHAENADLYREMSQKVSAQLDKGDVNIETPPPGCWVSWDWWNIHSASPASARGWRLLVRVTESDFVPPQAEGFIRPQNQVYVPEDFGW